MKLIINLLSSGVSYNVCRQNANRKKSEKTGKIRFYFPVSSILLSVKEITLLCWYACKGKSQIP